jgi:hypothetical protein
MHACMMVMAATAVTDDGDDASGLLPSDASCVYSIQSGKSIAS